MSARHRGSSRIWFLGTESTFKEDSLERSLGRARSWLRPRSRISRDFSSHSCRESACARVSRALAGTDQDVASYRHGKIFDLIASNVEVSQRRAFGEMGWKRRQLVVGQGQAVKVQTCQCLGGADATGGVGTHRSSSFLTISTTSSGSFWMFLRLRSTVTPVWSPGPMALASAAWFSLSRAVCMASCAKAMTCDGVVAL